jgi:hypothetical protein
MACVYVTKVCIAVRWTVSRSDTMAVKWFVCFFIMTMHTAGKGRYYTLATYISLLSILFILEANYKSLRFL